MHVINTDPLPTGWSEEPLGTLVTTKRGYSWAKEQERDRPTASTIPVIRIPNINETLDLSDLRHIEGVSADERTASAVTKGWTLLVGSNGNPKRIGDSALMEEDREMIFASFLFALRPKPDRVTITDEFLACWLQAHKVHEFISETSQMTTGLANMSWGACRRLPVRFPFCKDEQTRIAETLRAADDLVRALEQRTRKAERVAVALDQAHFAAGPHAVRFPYEYGTARTIPHGWASKRLGKIADVTSGITINQDREAADNGVRYLTVVNVYRGRIDLSEERYLESRGNEAESKRLNIGDVLVVEGHANPGEIGRAALVLEREAGMSFQNHLFRVRLENEAEVRAPFLVRALNSQRVRRHWAATSNTSSGLSTINRTALRRLIVPVPKPTEQDQIVERLEAAEDHISNLNRQLDSARRVKQSLLQNLLAGRVRLTA